MAAFGSFEGYYKSVYTDKVVAKMIPNRMFFHKKFRIRSFEKLGLDYKVPIELSREGGGTSNATTAEAYALNAAVSRTVQQATITSASYTHRAVMGYKQITSALKGAKKGGRAGREAFVDLTKDTARAQIAAATHDAEIQYRWGIGSANPDNSVGALSNLGEVLTSTQDSSGVYDLELTADSWCTAFWVANEGRAVDVRAVTTGATRLATTAATLTRVTPETYTIRITGTEADLAAIAPGDHLFWGTPSVTNYLNEMVGMQRILQNEGELFGIDGADFSLWRGNQFSAHNNPLSFGLIQQAEEYAAALGFEGALCVLCGTSSWNDLMQDEAALVDHVGGGKNVYARGASEVRFKGQTGTTEIYSDNLMKRGYAMILPKSEVVRLGANEGTFDMAGTPMIRQMENLSGVEKRYFWDKAVFLRTPAFGTFISGISPSSGT